MSENSAHLRRFRPGPLKLALAGSLLLMAAGSANASFCYVFWAVGAPCPIMETGAALAENTSSQANSLAHQIEAAQEYLKQASRWLETIQSFQDQLTGIQNTLSSFGLPQGTQLEHVPDDFKVVERCGSSDLGVGSVLGSMVGFDMQSSAKRKQQELCVSIQRMENRQYNEIIDYLKQAIAQMTSMQQQIGILRGAGSRTSGEMNGAIYNAERTNAEIKQKMGEFDARMAAYNTYVGSQRQVMKTLSQVTLRGQPSLVGEAIKTAALKTALSL